MESLENSATLYYLSLTLIHFLWQGGLIALGLKFCLVLTSFKQTNIRYFFSTTAMLLCFIAPIVTFSLIYQPDISPSVILQNAIPSLEADELFLVANPQTWQQELLGSLPFLSIIWLASVTFLALKLFIELYHVTQLPKRGVCEASNALNATFDELVAKMQLTRKPRLLIALQSNVPMAIGWLKPVVLIPAAMISGLTPAQLNMLMLHELAHIKRHDYLVNLLQTLVETLLFFHPAVRWISKHMRNEREYCSDDIAVSLSGDAFAYAHTLTDTASLCHQHRHHAIPTMAMAASGGDLKKRVLRLVDQHHCAKTDESGKFLASVLIITSILAVGLKPYVKMPIVDLSSGYISFATSTLDYPSETTTQETSLAEASIANLLIQQDREFSTSIPVQEPVITPKSAVTTNNKSNLQDEQSVTQAIEQSIAKQEQLLNKQVSKQSSIFEEKATPTAFALEPSKAIKVKTVLNQQEKSTSDLAFERTDSTNKSSVLANPYSQQVADLAQESMIEADVKRSHQEILIPKHRSKELTMPIVKETSIKITRPIRSEATLIVSPDPRYPSSAKRKGLELDIKVNFTIDTAGRVKNIEFEKKSRVSYFKSAIRNAMVKWRFQPAKVNGKPVESQMSKIFSFSLME